MPLIAEWRLAREDDVRVILITGANGNLGRRLLLRLAQSGQRARAVVRSQRAADQVAALELGSAVEVVQLDYLDERAMADAVAGCSAAVHLVGIIKEGAASRYADAHEGTTEVLARVAAAGGVERIVYLSIVGTATTAANACLASKARGEQILLAGQVPALILRVPMVLGEGDYASAALARRAASSVNVLIRGASLEQPIYAGDVTAAVLAALDRPEPLADALDLAGPEILSRSELTRRAAAALGRSTRILSLPLGVGLAVAWLLEVLSSNPPLTRAMLGVLDHDDEVDPSATLETLGITLTSLQETLANCLVRNRAEGAHDA